MDKYVKDMVWRDYTANKLLGKVLTKTSGEYLDSATRTGYEGFLYGSKDALVFIADKGLWGRDGVPNEERIFHMTYNELGSSLGILKTRGAPNVIVSFGNGMEFMGEAKFMKKLHKLAKR